MSDREIRKNEAKFVQHSVTAVKRATKKKPALVTFAVDDDLAKRIITNAMLKPFDSDFAVVGLMLQYTTIDYKDKIKPVPDTLDNFEHDGGGHF